MIFIGIIIIIGAITRLTNSGLSMPFWDLVEIIPPISDDDWKEKFQEYKSNSRADYLEQGIDNVSDFKIIFFWEYFHRLIARLVGVIAIFPYLFFLYKRNLYQTIYNNYMSYNYSGNRWMANGKKWFR